MNARMMLVGITAVAFMAVFFAVGGQAAWILRPYLGRPSEKHVPFLRASEGSFSDALFRSFRSARGIYDDDGRPPRPEDYPHGYPYEDEDGVARDGQTGSER